MEKPIDNPGQQSKSATPRGAAPRRRRWLVGLAIAFGCLIVLFGCAMWYLSSAGFENKVRLKVISTLEEATGGRVQLKSFRWNVFHLEFEADDLTIHGLEPAGELPYAHVDKLLLRLKILSLIHPAAGVRLLDVEHPVLHLIVNADGTTNQPTPKKVSSSNRSASDTIFDLQADSAIVNQGLIVINQRSLPLNLRAKDLSAAVEYVYSNGHYAASVSAGDVTTQMLAEPPLQSRFDARLDVARDSAQIQQLTWQTARSHASLTGSVQHFANPSWQLSAEAVADARDVAFLTGLDALRAGTVTAKLQGGGQGSGEAMTYSVDGSAKLTGLAYSDANLHLERVDLETPIHLSPTELSLSQVRGSALGGRLNGRLKILNWAASTAPSSPAALPKRPQSNPIQQGSLNFEVAGIDVPSALAAVLPPKNRQLGFNTAASGSIAGKWDGSPANIVVSADLKLSSLQRSSGVPAQGLADATYDGRRNSVTVRTLDIYTPASHITASGTLELAANNSNTAVQASLSTTDLSEFNSVLVIAGVGANKKGVPPAQTLPVELHGAAAFRGQIAGPLSLLRVTGHVDVTDFVTVIASTSAPTSGPRSASGPGTAVAATAGWSTPAQRIQWDALHADVDLSTAAIGIENAVITRGGTVITASGHLAAHELSRRRYAFDDAAAVNASAQIKQASLTDLESIAGASIPVTGTLNLNVSAQGTLGNLQGRGHIGIEGGEAYGEQYRSLDSDIEFHGSGIDLTHFNFREDGGKVTGEAGYNLDSKAIHAQLTGAGFDLAHFSHTASLSKPVGGKLNFVLNASGTVDQPILNGNLHLLSASVGSQQIGGLDAEVHTSGKTIFLTAQSNLLSSHLDVKAQVGIVSPYPAQGTLTFNGLDAAPLLAAYAPQGSQPKTDVGGTVQLSGPLATPKLLNVTVEIGTLRATLQKIELSNAGPLRLSTRQGVVHIDQFHITGTDTDLTAQGTAGIFTDKSLDLHANGSVNLQIAQTFSPEIISSGKANFRIDAGGAMSKPELRGNISLNDGNLAYLDFPNGLSHLNGTLEFNQDRLEVRKLTAQTGGGLVSLGGFLTYQNGIYSNLTATVREVRVRYPDGISASANADLKLLGSLASATLSGNLLITRFELTGAISASSSGAPVAAPPDPNSLANHIHLDIHMTSAPQLDFENSYASLSGDIDLRIRGTVESPSVLGKVNITRGTANLAGTPYQLQRGDIYFTNPVRIEPVVDLDASAQVRDYDISIGVHGTLSKLNVTYRSEPPLPQADIIALLALGRTQEESQIYQQEQAEAGVNSTTDALLGGALNATVSNRVEKLFGVGRVKIDPNFIGSLGNSTARVTVEQQLSRNVTLTFATNVNETSQELIQMQINLSQNVSLLAVRDEAGVFSMVLRYHQRKR